MNIIYYLYNLYLIYEYHLNNLHLTSKGQSKNGSTDSVEKYVIVQSALILEEKRIEDDPIRVIQTWKG